MRTLLIGALLLHADAPGRCRGRIPGVVVGQGEQGDDLLAVVHQAGGAAQHLLVGVALVEVADQDEGRVLGGG